VVVNEMVIFGDLICHRVSENIFKFGYDFVMIILTFTYHFSAAGCLFMFFFKLM